MKQFLYFQFLLLLFAACTRQLVEPKVFSLAGTVTLSGQTDYTGITVELYAADELDSTVANRVQRFPSVGPTLDGNPVFDHRLSDAVYSTITDADGRFSFSDVPDGQYNLVVEKTGFGWRYVYHVNAHSEPVEIKLYAEETQSGVIDTYEVWPADRHVIINGHVLIGEGATLLIDKGCVVRLAGDYEIRAEGSLQVNGTADAPVWFTANTPSKEPDYIAWRGILINKNTFMNHARIDFAETGIRTSGAEFSIRHSIISRVRSYGVLLTRESSGVFENNMLLNCRTGLGVEGDTEVDINHNIFAQSNSVYGTGVVVNTSQAQISDNIFSGFSMGATFEFNARGDFTHNYVDKCETGIFINKAAFSGPPPVAIKTNIFQAAKKTNIETYISVSPVIEENNFQAAGAGLFVIGFAIYYAGDKAVSYPNNYWSGLDDGLILSRIDVRDNDSEKEPFSVNINPVASEPVHDAGPR